jgi:hypothetical protein
MGIKELLTNDEVVIEILEELASRKDNDEYFPIEESELKEAVADARQTLKDAVDYEDKDELYSYCQEYIDAVDDLKIFERDKHKLNTLAKDLIKELKKTKS